MLLRFRHRVYITFIVIAAFLVPSLSIAQNVTTETINEIAWSPDGTRIAFADYSSIVEIWDITTSTHLLDLEAQTDYVSEIEWSPDNSRIATAHYDERTVRIWDAVTGELLISIDDGLGALSIVWTNDNSRIITGMDGIDFSPLLRVWDAATGDLLETYEISAVVMSWSPDHRILATIPSILIELWDATSFEFITQLTVEGDYELDFQPGTVAWSPDSRYLASGYLNGRVRVWEIETMEIVAEFRANDREMTGSGIQMTTVGSIAFNVDGTILYSVSHDGALRGWDIATGEVLVDVQFGTRIYAAAWSPYRARVAVGFTPAGENTSDTLLANGIEIILPMPTLNQLRAIANQCLAEDIDLESLSFNDLLAFSEQIELMSDEQISSACAADILALIDALRSE